MVYNEVSLMNEKLSELILRNEKLAQDIKNGKLLFTDNVKVIEFSEMVTEHLVTSYKQNEKLSNLELRVLDKVLDYHGINNIIFCLNSDIRDGDSEFIDFLESESFKLLGNIGYINID
jgi:hypothetical protein